MIVECEACGTKYRFDETLLRPEGVRVRCSRCGFTWTLYPEGREIAPKPKRRPTVLLIILLCLLALFGMMNRRKVLWLARETLQRFPLVRGEVRLLGPVGYRMSTPEGEIFVIEGKIQNLSGRTLKEVRLEAKLLDTEGRVRAKAEGIAGRYLPYDRLREMDLEALKAFLEGRPPDTSLLPGQKVPFTILFFSPPEGVKRFQIRVISKGWRARMDSK